MVIIAFAFIYFECFCFDIFKNVNYFQSTLFLVECELFQVMSNCGKCWLYPFLIVIVVHVVMCIFRWGGLDQGVFRPSTDCHVSSLVICVPMQIDCHLIGSMSEINLNEVSISIIESQLPIKLLSIRYHCFHLTFDLLNSNTEIFITIMWQTTFAIHSFLIGFKHYIMLFGNLA